jgi:hypothetical protein
LAIFNIRRGEGKTFQNYLIVDILASDEEAVEEYIWTVVGISFEPQEILGAGAR